MLIFKLIVKVLGMSSTLPGSLLGYICSFPETGLFY